MNEGVRMNEFQSDLISFTAFMLERKSHAFQDLPCTHSFPFIRCVHAVKRKTFRTTTWTPPLLMCPEGVRLLRRECFARESQIFCLEFSKLSLHFFSRGCPLNDEIKSHENNWMNLIFIQSFEISQARVQGCASLWSLRRQAILKSKCRRYE